MLINGKEFDSDHWNAMLSNSNPLQEIFAILGKKIKYSTLRHFQFFCSGFVNLYRFEVPYPKKEHVVCSLHYVTQSISFSSGY